MRMINQLTHFFVGSTNPAKLNSVRQATEQHYPEAQVLGFDVQSGVAAQPFSDEETLLGSENRAKAALVAGITAHPQANPETCLGVGLEGGVLEWREEMWTTVWVTVVDHSGQTYSGNGARIKVPQIVAEPIRQGTEMGIVMEKLSGKLDVRKGQGMFGIVTRDFVSRVEEYSAIAKFTIGLWYGRDWENELS